MKLETWHSDENKRLWEVVRLDNCTVVPCEILIAADEEKGEVTRRVAGGKEGENETLSFGAGGIKLVGKRR